MIKEEWQHNPELYFKATLLRLHRREVNITTDELAEAEKYVLLSFYRDDKVLCQIGSAEAWPDEPNGDMMNGHDIEVNGS